MLDYKLQLVGTLPNEDPLPQEPLRRLVSAHVSNSNCRVTQVRETAGIDLQNGMETRGLPFTDKLSGITDTVQGAGIALDQCHYGLHAVGGDFHHFEGHRSFATTLMVEREVRNQLGPILQAAYEALATNDNRLSLEFMHECDAALLAITVYTVRDLARVSGDLEEILSSMAKPMVPIKWGEIFPK